MPLKETWVVASVSKVMTSSFRDTVGVPIVYCADYNATITDNYYNDVIGLI